MTLALGRARTVNGVRLITIAPEQYISPDGLFWFVREDPFRPRRGWMVRALLGIHADPAGAHEPLVLDNGLSHADTLKEAVAYAYRIKWAWRGTVWTDEMLAEAKRDLLRPFRQNLETAQPRTSGGDDA